MESWHRWREPLAVVLLSALALLLAVRGGALVLAVEADAAGGFLGTLPGGDELLLLLAAAAVAWCATPVGPGAGDVGRTSTASPRARVIALAGLVVVGLTVVGWLALAGANVVAIATWPTPDPGFVLLMIEGLLRLTVPIVALIVVVAAVRRTAPARSAGLPALTAESESVAEDVPTVAAPPARLPAAWQADEATGAVWLTADDAADGRPGLLWSDPAGGGPAAITGGESGSGWANRQASPAAAEASTDAARAFENDAPTETTSAAQRPGPRVGDPDDDDLR